MQETGGPSLAGTKASDHIKAGKNFNVSGFNRGKIIRVGRLENMLSILSKIVNNPITTNTVLEPTGIPVTGTEFFQGRSGNLRH